MNQRGDAIIVFIVITLLTIAAVLWWIVSNARAAAAYKEQLMQQCMKDGRKEYECYSMLRTENHDVVAVPIFIPTR